MGATQETDNEKECTHDHTPSSAPPLTTTYRCKDCLSEIPSNAKKCTACQGYQDYRRWSAFFIPALSLVIALVAIIPTTLTPLVIALRAKDIDFYLSGYSSSANADALSIKAVLYNSGNRAYWISNSVLCESHNQNLRIEFIENSDSAVLPSEENTAVWDTRKQQLHIDVTTNATGIPWFSEAYGPKEYSEFYSDFGNWLKTTTQELTSKNQLLGHHGAYLESQHDGEERLLLPFTCAVSLTDAELSRLVKFDLYLSAIISSNSGADITWSLDPIGSISFTGN